MNPAVLRQQLGHSSVSMTARYTGKVSSVNIKAEFARLNGPRIVVLENKENASAA